MPQLVVPGSWHKVTSGNVRSELPAATLGELLAAFVRSYPEAAYRLYSPAGDLLRYHLFFVDGEKVNRATPPDHVPLEPSSRVEIIAPLAGG
ncbi:MoaD/ThiS family protein [Mycobacterium sp.]|uniref:MoaD/ThiS family protein n=1 Tax=Mycobacterium sp. TaxID=1785 RepID=UPI002BD62071|nr:MoaD/ThiS family protein [Mycobacterium sp.]HTY35340.1 MoaD/ThiS family protein [Mycobacterium sp.]